MVVVLAGMKLGAPVLGPLFLSVFFAMVLTPLLKWFTGRGLSYRSALALTVIVIIVLGIALIAFIVLSIVGLQSQLSGYTGRLAQTAGLLQSFFQFLTSYIQVSRVASVLFDGVFILFATLFLLLELPRFHASMVSRLGADNAVVRGTEELYHDIVDYFVVRIKVNFYTSVGVTVVLLVMGVDYALLWGLLAFALSFVPYFGYLIAAIPPILVAWIQYDLIGAVAVLALYGVINLIAEDLIFPQMVGKVLALPIYVVFASVFFWGWILGLPGVFLSVPLTMAVIILFDAFEETAWLVPILKGGRSKERTRSLFRRKVP